MTGVLRHPHGPRVYLAGHRVHHGAAGIALAALGFVTRQPSLTAIGLAAVAHDARDFPWRDKDNHRPKVRSQRWM